MCRKLVPTAVAVCVLALAFFGPFVARTQAQFFRFSRPFPFQPTPLGPPLITGFSPFSAPPGTLVSIRGQNLGGARNVRFNNVPTRFQMITSALIQAVVPPGAGTGPVSVTTPSGTTRSGAFFQTVPMNGAPAPELAQITIFAPVVGRAGTSVTISGRNFIGVRGVRFNGVRAQFFVVASDRIIAFVPPGARTGRIQVEGTTGIATSAGIFEVPR
ncbi:MAG: IPT/TIG domain-containing protein [Gemmataceae bacterium]|nr:IPT/TIG domain-containing protein [Gemmataceae bacterium]